MRKEKAYRVEKKALIDLISRITKEVEGVYSIKRGFFGKDIKIKEEQEGMQISLGLIAKKEVSIPTLVETVQRRLREEIEKTLGSPVRKINITIKGIKFSS